MAKLKTNITIRKTGIMYYIYRLNAVQPCLYMMSFCNNVVMIPIVFPDNFSNKRIRIFLYHIATAFLPQRAPITFSHIYLVAGCIVPTGRMYTNAHTRISIFVPNHLYQNV